MPDQENQTSPQSNPFDIVTPAKSKKSSKGIVIALVIVLFLALGIFAGVLLVGQRQEIREKAEQCTDDCGGAVETRLSLCSNSSCDKSKISLCTNAEFKGRIEKCGGKEYCCNGSKWVTDMSACTGYALCTWPEKAAAVTATATSTSAATTTATATAISTATAATTATSTSVSSSTKTPSPTPTKTSGSVVTAAPTKAPIPETGTGWPTFVGAGLGILVILGSLLLAL